MSTECALASSPFTAPPRLGSADLRSNYAFKPTVSAVRENHLLPCGGLTRR